MTLNRDMSTNVIKLTDVYVTTLKMDGTWQPTPLKECLVYKTLDNMDWSLHEDYVGWLKRYNNHPGITTTEQYKHLYKNIRTNGFKFDARVPISFKDVIEYLCMYDICGVPRQMNWLWVVKDGQHRLSCLLYLYREAALTIDKNHILKEIVYG